MDADFDVDKMIELAKNDPDEYERYTRGLIEDFLNSIPDPKIWSKLRRMQLEIDKKRKNYNGNHFQFANHLIGEMTTSFLELNEALNVFRPPM